MPWVFTYNDWSAGTEYDMMVKAAVRSAILVARMKPYCMYSGSTTSPIYAFLVDAGVTIIQVRHPCMGFIQKQSLAHKNSSHGPSHSVH